MKGALGLTCSLVAAAFAGCGGSDDSSGAARAATTAGVTSAPTAAAASTTPPPRGALIKVARSQFGRILVDRRGQALYLFTRDRRGGSRCYGDCAAAWPPLYTKSQPVAGRSVTAGKLGTIHRRNGRLQVTYGGRPLYYFVSDSPGRILCQNVKEFGGFWLVVKPSGAPVR
jgi:predicted lipoprotein with Yx(FWY)xxD motif